MTVMICGYFNAAFGASINLFETLSTPIVEQFDASDRLDVYLCTAFDNSSPRRSARAPCQVIAALVRRSLKTNALGLERFTLLGDPQIARVFADMGARPAAQRCEPRGRGLPQPVRLHGPLFGGPRPVTDAGAARHPHATSSRPTAHR